MIQQKVEELVSEDFLGHVGQSTVKLDQQSVGRLSRMDALQFQAMAQAQQRRRDNQKTLLLLLCFGWMRESLAIVMIVVTPSQRRGLKPIPL